MCEWLCLSFYVSLIQCKNHIDIYMELGFAQLHQIRLQTEELISSFSVASSFNLAGIYYTYFAKNKEKISMSSNPT